MIVCVTGTSTGVGKTVASAALAAALAPAGDVTVFKPAQTGFATGARYDSAGQLCDAGEVARLVPSVRTVENLRYPDPLAPLTAARRAGLRCVDRRETVAAIQAFGGHVLVEGAGGVLVRLGTDGGGSPFTLIDLAADLRCGVVVVADPALGTLNHTELTVRALQAQSVRCAGVVLSRWPSDPGLVELCNLKDLPALTGVDIVGRIPDGAVALAPERFRATAPTWFDASWLRSVSSPTTH